MNQMKEFHEIKQLLLEKINNGPKDESRKLCARIHDLIVSQQKTIAEQKQQSRFKLVMELGTENMELYQEIKELEIDRDKYKQAYESLVKAM